MTFLLPILLFCTSDIFKAVKWLLFLSCCFFSNKKVAVVYLAISYSCSLLCLVSDLVCFHSVLKTVAEWFLTEKWKNLQKAKKKKKSVLPAKCKLTGLFLNKQNLLVDKNFLKDALGWNKMHTACIFSLCIHRKPYIDSSCNLFLQTQLSCKW